MKLSTRTRYGLRFLLQLAGSEREGNPLKLREVSEREGISGKYLGQIASQLRVAGLVKSVRGAGGGYRLGRYPSGITLMDLIEALEGGVIPADCLEGASCSRMAECVAREVWQEVQGEIEHTLARITLQDAIELGKKKYLTLDFSI